MNNLSSYDAMAWGVSNRPGLFMSLLFPDGRKSVNYNYGQSFPEESLLHQPARA